MKELSTEELRAYQLQILGEVDHWCRAHHLAYFIAKGTLLGAVRHHGYIPWDDDIDLVMKREEFERFLREFNRDRTDELEVLHCSIVPDFPYEFAKIHLKNTRVVEDIDRPYNLGINIDLFVLDYVDLDSLPKLCRKVRFLQHIISWKNMLGNRDRKRVWYKRAAVSAVKGLTRWIPMRWCTRTINAVAAESSRRADRKWLTKICQMPFTGKEILEADWFDETAEYDFEGLKVQGPANYDGVLSTWFGAYRELPPAEEQVTHHRMKAYV